MYNTPLLGIVTHVTAMVTPPRNASLILMRKGLMGIVTTVTSTNTKMRYVDKDNGKLSSIRKIPI